MPTPDRLPDPDDRPADGWPAAPDRWVEADREYEAKWSDEPDRDPDDATDAVGPAPVGYEPSPATAKAVHDSYRDGMQAAGPYLGLGVQIAGSMALFAGGGYAVDRWLGTSPWGILLGALLGMAGIVALLVRVSREADRKR
ncbi:MAG TPA: AtpZ/AtpI family protein [Rubricoccaceae bacterium]|jgi:hypothetical protein